MDRTFLSVKTKAAQAGGGIVEAVVGTSIAVIGIAGLTLANGNCLSIARAHRELLTADHCLQQRADQFRGAGWSQITGASGVQSLLNVAAVNDDSLASHVEQVTVTAYPAVVPAVAPIVVTRDATGNTTITSQPPAGFILRNSAAVRLDFEEDWASSSGNRPRSRQTSTVIAFGGLLPH